jgi:hypothetical protein
MDVHVPTETGSSSLVRCTANTNKGGHA